MSKRIINTFEELDALPNGSVVLDRNGLSLHKMGPLGMWNASNRTWDVQRDELEADAFPATILYAPGRRRMMARLRSWWRRNVIDTDPKPQHSRLDRMDGLK